MSSHYADWSTDALIPDIRCISDKESNAILEVYQDYIHDDLWFAIAKQECSYLLDRHMKQCHAKCPNTDIRSCVRKPGHVGPHVDGVYGYRGYARIWK